MSAVKEGCDGNFGVDVIRYVENFGKFVSIYELYSCPYQCGYTITFEY